MSKPRPGLRYGPLGPRTAHLCVDLQLMFRADTPWRVEWMDRVLPVISHMVQAHPRETAFTRFMPPETANDAQGMWRRLYRKWEGMTLQHLDRELVDIIPELKAMAPDAPVIDKAVYSPWLTPDLKQALDQRQVDTLVITGGETDICVLAAVMGAVDHGFRTILVSDATCSCSDDQHDAVIDLYCDRFSVQVEVADAAETLRNWSPA